MDLAPDLLEDLRGYVAGLPNKDPNRLLFSTSTGTPLDPKNVVKVALAGFKLRQLRWHDLRHAYASLQLSAGANIKYLSQQMGHASVQITLDRYSHLLTDSHPAQAARLSAMVFDGASVTAPAGDRQPARANVALKESSLRPQNTMKDGERSVVAIEP